MRIVLSTQTDIHYKLGISNVLNFPINIHRPEILCQPMDGDNCKHNEEGSRAVETERERKDISWQMYLIKLCAHHHGMPILMYCDQFLNYQRIYPERTVVESSSFLYARA